MPVLAAHASKHGRPGKSRNESPRSSGSSGPNSRPSRWTPSQTSGATPLRIWAAPCTTVPRSKETAGFVPGKQATLTQRPVWFPPGDDDDQSGDDVDDPDRMPSRATVTVIDEMGSKRVAVRDLGEPPHEVDSDNPVGLGLQGFGQGETGTLARGYRSDPVALLHFLDQFVDLSPDSREESRLIAGLEENAGEMKRTGVDLTKIPELEKVLRGHEAQLLAAQNSRLEVIAKWATRLAGGGRRRVPQSHHGRCHGVAVGPQTWPAGTEWSSP
jgi:hypothetical protein